MECTSFWRSGLNHERLFHHLPHPQSRPQTYCVCFNDSRLFVRGVPSSPPSGGSLCRSVFKRPCCLFRNLPRSGHSELHHPNSSRRGLGRPTEHDFWRGSRMGGNPLHLSWASLPHQFDRTPLMGLARHRGHGLHHDLRATRMVRRLAGRT